MSTIFLLMLSNVFMTFAWYGHLKYGHDWPLGKAILVFVGNRTVRVLFGGARQSLWLCSVLRISTQDHSRGDHDLGLHRVRDFLSQGKARLELSRGIRLPRGRCILRLRVQGTGIRHLNAQLLWRSTEFPPPQIRATPRHYTPRRAEI